MGWDFTHGASKADIVADRTKGWETTDRKVEIIAHAVIGSVLYLVAETTWKQGREAREGVPERKDGGPFDCPVIEPRPAVPPGGKTREIGISLLRSERGYGWGSKDLSESSGPYDANACPLYMLDMVPCPGGYATRWRSDVRTWHAERRERAAARRKIVPGTVLFLPTAKPKGPFVVEATPEGRRGRGSRSLNVRDRAGFLYRCGPRLLKGAVLYADLAAFDAANPDPLDKPVVPVGVSA